MEHATRQLASLVLPFKNRFLSSTEEKIKGLKHLDEVLLKIVQLNRDALIVHTKQKMIEIRFDRLDSLQMQQLDQFVNDVLLHP